MCTASGAAGSPGFFATFVLLANSQGNWRNRSNQQPVFLFYEGQYSLKLFRSGLYEHLIYEHLR